MEFNFGSPARIVTHLDIATENLPPTGSQPEPFASAASVRWMQLLALLNTMLHHELGKLLPVNELNPNALFLVVLLCEKCCIISDRS